MLAGDAVAAFKRRGFTMNEHANENDQWRALLEVPANCSRPQDRQYFWRQLFGLEVVETKEQVTIALGHPAFCSACRSRMVNEFPGGPTENQKTIAEVQKNLAFLPHR